MSAVPSPTASTFPESPPTVTTDVLLLVHFTTLKEASDGLTVAVSCPVSPIFKDIDVLSRLMPVTLMPHTAYSVTSLSAV